MSYLPFEQSGSLRIGTVDFVSPDKIEVTLEIEAPESVALNAGIPRPFPRVNGYLLIPVDEGFLVGQIEWLTIERSAFPKRRGMQDFGLVDLPYPLRKLRLNPLGMLQEMEHERFVFRRGADALPSVGDTVLMPTESQLRSIVESGEQRRVKIGSSPIAGNAEVCVDPNRLFGRHLAVLGNTGSGKSCSVAGLIRWSLEQSTQQNDSEHPNARFIILDPNGEYSHAFDENESSTHARIFRVNADSDADKPPLKVPLWFWNSAEWSSFTQASTRTQRPLLKRALREVKAGRTGVSEATEEGKILALRRYLLSRLNSIQNDVHSGAIQDDHATKFGFKLKAIGDDIESRHRDLPGYGLDEIKNKIGSALDATYKSFHKNGEYVEYYRAFTEAQANSIVSALQKSLEQLGGTINYEGPSEDVPLFFKGTDFADHLEVLAYQENVSQYLDFLIARIRTFLSDPKMKAIIDDTHDITLDQWLKDYIGEDNARNGCVSVIDLSLVPTEVIHVVTAVIARMVFESLQRYVNLNHATLPTVLVMEEAHTFIKRYRDDIENIDAATVCCQVFERIAREGRKFGLGLVLSSQRPSELSPTVLSQCNTFLLHRISNDRDQELVHRLVPDNLKGILRELPLLPSQSAILLGWASELPVLVKINDLPESQRPRSEDPEFWKVWTREEDREIDWGAIAKDWQREPRHEKKETANDQESSRDDSNYENEDDLPF